MMSKRRKMDSSGKNCSEEKEDDITQIKAMKEKIRDLIDELSNRTREEYLFLTVSVQNPGVKCQGTEVACNFISKNTNVLQEFFKFCADVYPAKKLRREGSRRCFTKQNRNIKKGCEISFDFTEISSLRADKIQNQTSDDSQKPSPVKLYEKQDLSEKVVDLNGKKSDNFESDSSANLSAQKLQSENTSSCDNINDRYRTEKGSFACEDCGHILSWRKSYYRHKRLYCHKKNGAADGNSGNTHVQEHSTKTKQRKPTVTDLQVQQDNENATVGNSGNTHVQEHSTKTKQRKSTVTDLQVQQGNENDRIDTEKPMEMNTLEISKCNNELEREEISNMENQEFINNDSKTTENNVFDDDIGGKGQESKNSDQQGTDVNVNDDCNEDDIDDEQNDKSFESVQFNGEDISDYFDMSFLSGEKGEFRCKRCSKTLHWKKSCIRHLNSLSCVEGVKSDNDFSPVQNENGKFACHKCGAEMTWKKSLLRHLRANFCSANTTLKFKNKSLDQMTRTNSDEIKFVNSELKSQENTEIGSTLNINSEYGTDTTGCCEKDLNEGRTNSKLNIEMEKGLCSGSGGGNNATISKCADVGEATGNRSSVSENPNTLSLKRKEFSSCELPVGDITRKTNSSNIKPHKCKLCNLAFATKSKCLRHVNLHHKLTSKQTTLLRCDICNKSFRNRLAAVTHRMKIHKKNEAFHCRRCQHKFKNLSDYRSHLNGQLCTQVFKCSEETQLHFDGDHDDTKDVIPLNCIECRRNLNDVTMRKEKKKYKCDICQKDFSRLFEFQKHKYTHVQVKVYNCHICQKSFVQVRHLYSHYIDTHKEKHSICKYCGLLFPSKSLLMDHMRNQHKVGTKIFTCCHCDLEFQNRHHYYEHLRIHSLVPYSMCEKCGKSFSTASSLKYHMSTHSEDSVHHCEKCGKTLTSESSYRRHVRLHNFPDTRPKCQCDECGQFFSAPHVLRKHKLRHIAEPAFQCSICSVKFRSVEGLNHHRIRLHMTLNDISKCGFKVRECSHCGKFFTQKQRYLLHMANHTGEKPFKCSKCDKSFAVKSLLKRHLVSHLKPFRCGICDSNFSAKSQWKRHIKTQKHIVECKKAGINFAESQTSFLDSSLWTTENADLNSIVQERKDEQNIATQIDQEIEQSVENIKLNTEKDLQTDSVEISQNVEVMEPVQGVTDQSIIRSVDQSNVNVENGVDCIILNITQDDYENPVSIAINLGANEAVYTAM